MSTPKRQRLGAVVLALFSVGGILIFGVGPGVTSETARIVLVAVGNFLIVASAAGIALLAKIDRREGRRWP